MDLLNVLLLFILASGANIDVAKNLLTKYHSVGDIIIFFMLRLRIVVLLI